MSESKHSPAPWIWHDNLRVRYERAEPGKDKDLSDLGGITDSHGCVVCHFGNDETYYPTAGIEPSPADRAIMVAAPELLAILERVLDELDNAEYGDSPSLDTLKDIRTAIAKAKGEA